jgi:hypothetical protein
MTAKETPKQSSEPLSEQLTPSGAPVSENMNPPHTFFDAGLAARQAALNKPTTPEKAK